MRSGLSTAVSRRVLRAIDRYQARPHEQGRCRFHPTCSEFAREAFETRGALRAVLLVGFRILRCNPLQTRRAHDPVVRNKVARANSAPTALAVLALSGFVVVVTAGVAQALGVSGGCTATVNGRDPASMTSSNPLVVHKGEKVSVTGVAPPSVQALPKEQVSSNTHIDVSIVEGVFGVSSSDHPGTGPQWGGTQNVDDYLKYGVGLYKVKGVATGTPGWSCAGEGYVKLADGNPLTKPIGATGLAMAVIGAGGAALAARPKAEPPMSLEEEEAMQEPADTLDGFFGMGCIAFLAGAFAGAKGIAGSFAMAAPAMAGQPRRRVWVRGHAVSGFFAGLLFGIGAAVVAQQCAWWPLTIVTAIVFPVVCGLICGLRAWMGRPWTVKPQPSS